ncbi:MULTISPECIES: hypothetical protein [Sphingobium]|uniref:hypothetical protein n=1 Tax=Sphingobium TaxID=165695 RepID=UPI00159C4C17|nr:MULTISPECIES: hypothetical protein [unclassified Sphingobium]
MANLTKEQMLDILLRHDAAEARGDLDAVMATVSPNPFYEFHPAGITLDTVEAVRELYRTALPGYVQLLANAKQLDFWTNDTSCAAEFEFLIPLESGEYHRARLFVIIEFDGDLLQTERGYIDFIFEKHHSAVLGEDLLTFPGVRVINAATRH